MRAQRDGVLPLGPGHLLAPHGGRLPTRLLMVTRSPAGFPCPPPQASTHVCPTPNSSSLPELDPPTSPPAPASSCSRQRGRSWPMPRGSGLPGTGACSLHCPPQPLRRPGPQALPWPGPEPSTTSSRQASPGIPWSWSGGTDQGSAFCTPRVDPSTLTPGAPGGRTRPHGQTPAGGRTRWR